MSSEPLFSSGLSNRDPFLCPSFSPCIMPLQLRLSGLDSGSYIVEPTPFPRGIFSAATLSSFHSATFSSPPSFQQPALDRTLPYWFSSSQSKSSRYLPLVQSNSMSSPHFRQSLDHDSSPLCLVHRGTAR